MTLGRALLCAAFLLGPFSAAGAGTPYSADQARAFHRAWSLSKWDKGGDLTRYTFLRMSEFFPHALIARAGPVAALTRAPNAAVANFVVKTGAGAMTLADYARDALVDAVLVVHRGRIVFERYDKMRPRDKHLLMSVSKVFAATLIAILEDRGEIESRRPIEQYLPALKTSGWRGVAVRDILDMASGIGCLETDDGAYTDPATCYYQYEASLGWLPATARTAATTRTYMASLERARPAGEAFEYTSVNTFILSWLAEAVTGKPYARLLSDEVWAPIGAGSDALISISAAGAPAAHGGISATLRDLARFGLLFTPSAGVVTSTPIVSARFAAQIRDGGRPGIFAKGAMGASLTKALGGEHPRHNSQQWDLVMADGDFFKGGFGGQGLYVSPRRDLVIAFFGTLDKQGHENRMLYVARQLAKSGLFGP